VKKGLPARAGLLSATLSPLLEERVARRAGCGAAAGSGVMDGGYAANTASGKNQRFLPASPCGEAFFLASSFRMCYNTWIEWRRVHENH